MCRCVHGACICVSADIGIGIGIGISLGIGMGIGIYMDTCIHMRIDMRAHLHRCTIRRPLVAHRLAQKPFVVPATLTRDDDL